MPEKANQFLTNANPIFYSLKPIISIFYSHQYPLSDHTCISLLFEEGVDKRARFIGRGRILGVIWPMLLH